MINKLPELFVLGNPRSGTTVLRLALAAHPNLCIPPECGFALWLASTYAEADFPQSYDAFIDDVINTRKFETWNLTREDLNRIGDRAKPRNYAEATGCIYRAYAQKIEKGSAIMGDKNNFYINEIELLNRIYPQAKVVWICRDPRDVFCSYKDLNNRNISTKYAPRLEADASKFSEQWLEADDERLKAKKVIGERLAQIRYEDLVSKPVETLTIILKLLNLHFDKEMLEFYRKSDEPKQFLQWKEKIRQPFNKSSLGRFHKDLTNGERSAIEEVLSIRMSELGYRCA